MIEIKTRFRQFNVYTVEEAQYNGLEMYDNQHALEMCKQNMHEKLVGKWYITEDGYVVAIKKATLSHGKRISSKFDEQKVTIIDYYCFTTDVGSFQISKYRMRSGDSWTTSNINFMARHAIHKYYGPNHQTWGANMMRKSKVRKTLLAHVYLMVKNKFTRETELSLANYLYPKHQKTVLASYRRLLKQPEVKEFMENEFKNQLIGSGVTEQYLATTLYEAIELAKTRKNPDAMIRGVALGAKLSGLEPAMQKTVVTQTAQLTMKDAKELADSIESAKLTMRKKQITSAPLQIEESVNAG